MNKQSIVIAVIIGIAIIASVIIYTQSTRYQPQAISGNRAIYVIDKQTGKTKVVAGGQEFEAKPREEILTPEQVDKEYNEIVTKAAEKIRKENGYKPPN